MNATNATSTAPQTQYLRLPGGTLAFDDTPGTGGGAPVLLLPGMLQDRALFRHLRPLLAAAGHRVITMDLRGWGESSIDWDDYSPASAAADAIALLDHLKIDKAVLVGHSYCGASVVRVAADAPERVAGIVLMNAFIEKVPATAFEKAMVKTLGSAVLAFPKVWGYYLNKVAYPGGVTEEIAAYNAGLVADLRTPGRRKATRGQVFGDSAPIGWSTGVNVPTLVVMGSKDPDFPDPELVAGRQVAALNGRKVMIDGAGHYPQAQFPQATADALLPFLKEVA
ncbi:pimeloyl-ACP methyl ester carboxylesterase [Kitasatospora sp. GP30]|uniref:alpha/beta fold hydrolase n=1 Tax=Kitasatospora sp. GP30 TaxID=3035084 RepID=UPI000C7021C2|nr:alpha/beta hydrolase [Kitasatospora sp. GP30]MDH6144935.1 pimeloyl-ACP methyl ester carboxylesterase [Kitasatospora sp. GP30]